MPGPVNRYPQRCLVLSPRLPGSSSLSFCRGPVRQGPVGLKRQRPPVDRQTWRWPRYAGGPGGLGSSGGGGGTATPTSLEYEAAATVLRGRLRRVAIETLVIAGLGLSLLWCCPVAICFVARRLGLCCIRRDKALRARFQIGSDYWWEKSPAAAAAVFACFRPIAIEENQGLLHNRSQQPKVACPGSCTTGASNQRLLALRV